MNTHGTSLINKIEEWTTIAFFCATAFILIFLTQSLILTWFNQFQIQFLSVAGIISFFFTTVFFYFLKKDIILLPRLNIPVLVIISFISLILIFFPHDTFGGRDEGTYAGLAMILTKHQSLSIPSYLYKAPLLYGIPGDNFTFGTPAYIVWLAAQNVLFGASWMLRSNVILILLGLCSLFLTSSLIAKKSLALMTVLLFGTSMPFLWFSRETLTENLAFFLLWPLLLSLFLFIKTKKYYFLSYLFLSSWLLAFTRNEGMFMQIPVLVILATVLVVEKVIPLKRTISICFMYLLLVSSSFVITNTFSPLKNNLEISGTISIFTHQISRSTIVKLGERFPSFVFQMLSKQNLSLALYSFILVIAFTSVHRKYTTKKYLFYICMVGVLSVEFLKLINPSVTLEQPWMYRRYLYALLPFGYLSLLMVLDYLIKQRRASYYILSGILLGNMLLSKNILFLKNNWSITEKVDKLLRPISEKDFLIVDDKILQNYSLLYYVALHKEIRNLYDYWMEAGTWLPKEKKFQEIPYSRLFLLSDVEGERYKDFTVKRVGDAQIESRQLQGNCDLNILRNSLKLKTNSMLYLPYFEVIKYCNTTNNEIVDVKKKVILYELLND